MAMLKIATIRGCKILMAMLKNGNNNRLPIFMGMLKMATIMGCQYLWAC